MVTAEYFAEYEKRLAFYKAQAQWLEAEKRLAELRYNPYHDPKSGKFTTAKNNISGAGKRYVKKPNEYIGKSSGAASKNYPVKLPEGGYGKFTEGTSITKIKVFAGYGTNTPIKNEIFIKSKHNIDCKKLQKVRGEAVIKANKQNRKAEIHWYEDEKSNKYDIKVKRWFE